MATYAIGDLQGCYQDLINLLDEIKYDPDHDRLWFTGDLVNRGPESLKTLRYVKSLGNNIITVLGNHDLHVLGCAYVERMKPKSIDRMDDILAAEDMVPLLDWLRQQPLAHFDVELNFLLVHAGVPVDWTLEQTLVRAKEVESRLAGDEFINFLETMYGDEPDQWRDSLSGADRLRYITNGLTRMRYCYADGRLELGHKGPLASAPQGLLPWFRVTGRRQQNTPIVFGHWSTLRITPADMQRHSVYPVDTGNVWGGELTAMRLEDRAFFSVKGSQSIPVE